MLDIIVKQKDSISSEEINNEVINKRNILILKDFLDRDVILNIKNKIFDWGLNTPEFNPDLDQVFDNSYHRIDDNPSQSKTKHIFHAYNFTNDANVDFYQELVDFLNPLRELQAKLSGQQLENKPNKDGYALRPQAIHYPVGGGFFDWHIHPFLPQKVGLILSMSQRGRDFDEGGTMFKIDNKVVSIENDHDIGDLGIFRYDIEHKVDVIDASHGRVDFNNIRGKWSLILPYY